MGKQINKGMKINDRQVNFLKGFMSKEEYNLFLSKSNKLKDYSK